MAILKHISVKNRFYSDAVEYLTCQFDEYTNKPILDGKGRIMERENYLIDGVNCDVDSFGAECIETNRFYGKNNSVNDVKAHHYIISFEPEDDITMEQAMEFGKKWLAEFAPGHQAVVAVHPDGHNNSRNMHIHMVINSVRKFPGRKSIWHDKPCEWKQCCKHKSYAFIVLSAMLAFAIITLSPFVIKCRKKMKDPAEIEESYRYKYIEEWYIHIYGSAKGVAVIITMIVLFIGGTCVLTYFGLPFLAFLLFYVDVWIYCLWKNHVKRTFYKVPDGAKRCELIYVKDIAFLDLLNSQTALCYFSKPSDEMLDFLYNRFYSETLNQKRLLMNEHLKIYVVNGRVFNEKYGISKYDLPMSDEECLLCILPDELNPEVMSSKEVALRDYEIGGGLFSEYVENCPELM